jgi:hypothetical protein
MERMRIKIKEDAHQKSTGQVDRKEDTAVGATIEGEIR